jgi:hypothetical protein
MKPLKVQIIEFFLDHLMRQHHEIERDLSAQIDKPNVIQMYSLDNYRGTFVEQIRLGKEVGLSAEETWELARLVKKDEFRQFEDFSTMGLGAYVARLQFGAGATDVAGGRYDLFRYKDYYLFSSNSVAGRNHYRLCAAEELAVPFFFDFCLREEYGEKGIRSYSAFRPVMLQTSEEMRLELRSVFSGYVMQSEPGADDLAEMISALAIDTDFQQFERLLRKYKHLYKEAAEDAYILLRMADPDPERITFTFPGKQLAAWLESLSDSHARNLCGYLFMVLSKHFAAGGSEESGS